MSRVANEVINVRAKGWFSERLVIDSEVPYCIPRKFSRVRSNITMVSLGE